MIICINGVIIATRPIPAADHHFLLVVDGKIRMHE